jgi:hypothetical protein
MKPSGGELSVSIRLLQPAPFGSEPTRCQSAKKNGHQTLCSNGIRNCKRFKDKFRAWNTGSSSVFEALLVHSGAQSYMPSRKFKFCINIENDRGAC